MVSLVNTTRHHSLRRLERSNPLTKHSHVITESRRIHFRFQISEKSKIWAFSPTLAMLTTAHHVQQIVDHISPYYAPRKLPNSDLPICRFVDSPTRRFTAFYFRYIICRPALSFKRGRRTCDYVILQQVTVISKRTTGLTRTYKYNTPLFITNQDKPLRNYAKTNLRFPSSNLVTDCCLQSEKSNHKQKRA